MPKRSRKEMADPNLSAARVLKEVLRYGDVHRKDPLAVELGRRGGLKGGQARAAKMTKKQRTESARNAARARWAK